MKHTVWIVYIAKRTSDWSFQAACETMETAEALRDSFLQAEPDLEVVISEKLLWRLDNQGRLC